MAATPDITGGLDCEKSQKTKANGESLQKLAHRVLLMRVLAVKR